MANENQVLEARSYKAAEGVTDLMMKFDENKGSIPKTSDESEIKARLREAIVERVGTSMCVTVGAMKLAGEDLSAAGDDVSNSALEVLDSMYRTGIYKGGPEGETKYHGHFGPSVSEWNETLDAG